MRHTMAIVAFGGLSSWTSLAQAGPCAGASPFLDIPSSAGYCTEVEWLKNRGVVTAVGCGGGNYCPTNFVQRSGMAQFMKRLGDKLTPELLFVEGSTGAIVVPANAPLPLRCVTPDTPAAGYPRSAVVMGTFTGLADGNAIAYRSGLVYSDDGGVTWKATPTQVNPRASSGAGQWSGLSANSRIDLAPNLAYRFAMPFRRDDLLGGTAGNLADGRCQMTVLVYSRTGTSTPFDAAAAGDETD